MGNDKSKFLVFRSLFPWVALVLAISFIWLGGVQNTSAMEVPPAPQAQTAPPTAPDGHATLTINLYSGRILRNRVAAPENGTIREGNDIPQIPDNAQAAVTVIKYNRNPNCITIYQYGQPIEVCGP